MNPRSRDLRHYRERKRSQKLGPKRAEGAFGAVLKRNGIAKELREHRILLEWETIVGPRVAAKTLPDALDKGTLWVRVASSSWMHQLSFLKSDILNKANEVCQANLVNDIRFHLGPAKTRNSDPLSAALRIRRPPMRHRKPPPPPSSERIAEIERETSTVEDEELRLRIRNLRSRWDL